MKKVLCSLFVCMLVISCGKKQEPEAVKLSAKVNFAAGEVSINGKPVKDGAPVNFGDAIETGKSSSCEILIETKNLIKIGGSSRLIFNISRDGNELILEKGWLAGITRKKFTKEGKYLIKTPTVVASVRGTSYCVMVEKPDSTYFCVCNGTINLEGKSAGKGEDVTSQHHTAKRFIMDSSGKLKIESPGMLHHDDKGIENLAEKIQEKVDWKKAD